MPSGFLELDGGAVTEDLGDALHDFSRIVADTDYGVASGCGGVLQHAIESVVAGFFAEIGEECDVSADERLQAGTDGAEDRSRADYYTANDTEIAGYMEARKFEGRGRHFVRNHGRVPHRSE
jgi:hypothetical protein